MNGPFSDMTSPFLSPELERLLNPAYCCSLLSQYVYSYVSSSRDGLPYPLIFFCLPLVLHEKTCKKINEYSSSSGLHSFVTENSFILVELGKRFEGFHSVTQKALLFGIASKVLFVEPDHLVVSSVEAFVRQVKVSLGKDIAQPYQAVQRLGSWFSQLKMAEVFLFLGLQP